MSGGVPLILVDPNVFISYLLPSTRSIRSVTILIEALIIGDVRHVLPNEVVDELIETIAAKRKLRSRIPPDRTKTFVSELSRISSRAVPIEPPYPSVVRDAKDDYLIAYAFSERVDFLVTYDDDLLSLPLPQGSPRIVSPPMFLELIGRLNQKPFQR